MSLEKAWPQMSRQLELPIGRKGEARSTARSEEALSAIHDGGHPGASGLMELVINGGNLRAALKRVRKNKGSPGVDGMTVDELPEHLKAVWPELREQLLSGSYEPQPVRRHLIPKAGGGERELGIPTARDRFIQQALLQVLQPMFDPNFSEHSHGFRPGRSAHGAIREAQRYIQAGAKVVVDVDLSKFFDRVHHDLLMGRLAKSIGDRRMLRVIRRFLRAGVMMQGVVMERHMGTPQGGPLSPLLANILLDEVDKDLERRGHAFVRYADDLRVFVFSKRAGDRVMAHLRRHFGRLHLVINEEKSAVASAYRRPFLGFSFWGAKGGVVKMRVASKALKTMRDRIRLLTRRSAGRSLKQVALELRRFLVGWRAYFRLATSPGTFKKIDIWIRRRLRAVQIKQWCRSKKPFLELRKAGMGHSLSYKATSNGGRYWYSSKGAINVVLNLRFFDELGIPSLAS